MVTQSPDGADSRDRVSISLPFTAESAGVARHRLQSWLAGRGSDVEVVDDCELVVTELVGNAVRHARPLSDGTLTVTWARTGSGTLEISVTDGGSPSLPHRIDAGVSDLAGRGLVIVETIAARWWTENTRTRSTVHALMALV